MDLILWRHAEAEDPRPGVPDARRRLTPKGEKQACRMAKWLKKRLPKGTRILVSPTERTRMTAHALGLPFEIERSIGPDASAADLLSAAGLPQGKGAVLIVGHQPTLGQAASLLLTGNGNECSVGKAAVWWFKTRSDSEPSAQLRAVIGPGAV